MNSKIFFVILLLLAGVVVFGMASKTKPTVASSTTPSEQTTSQTSQIASQTKTMGVVEVEITPVTIDQGKQAVFDVALNNHSVDLNYDYTKIALLTDDAGNTYQPVKWDGNSGGHHVRGQLTFEPLHEQSGSLTLSLSGIDNQNGSFTFNY